MSWECFWVEDSGTAKTWLRRYEQGSKHDRPGHPHGYHQAFVFFENMPCGLVDDGHGRKHWEGLDDRMPPKDDVEWPRTCDHCDYVFTKDDAWQLHQQQIYKADDGRGEWAQRELPVGAMFDAGWLPWKGPDGKSITVVLPLPSDPSQPGMHVWHIDGPAGGTDRRPWQRTGTPPKINVTPSIMTPTYHGFLQNGVLTDPL